MASFHGCSQFCQECGACQVRSPERVSHADTNLIDTVVEQVVRSLRGTASNPGHGQQSIPLGVSNRHIHLQRDSFKLLFGVEAEMEKYRDLYQPGEFACTQTCLVIGPKMRPIENVRVLGPYRKYDQVEISFTDAMVLGLRAPVRESGNLEGAAPITIVGPKGTLVLKEGAIIANRHVHMSSRDAAGFGVKQGEFIKIQIPGIKSTLFERTLVRTNDAWKLQLHLDTDDANAAHVVCDQKAIFLGKA